MSIVLNAAPKLPFLAGSGTSFPSAKSAFENAPLLVPAKLYYRLFGRLFEVKCLAPNMDEANAWMVANRGDGLIAELPDGWCVIASTSDMGVESIDVPGLGKVS